VQKLSQEQFTFNATIGRQTPVPIVKYGAFLADLSQYFAVKDVNRYIEEATTPQLPLEQPDEGGTNTIGEGGGSSPPTGQDPMQAAIQGAQGAALGGLSQNG